MSREGQLAERWSLEEFEFALGNMEKSRHPSEMSPRASSPLARGRRTVKVLD